MPWLYFCCSSRSVSRISTQGTSQHKSAQHAWAPAACTFTSQSLAGGWDRVQAAARQVKTTADTAVLVHHLAALRKVSFPPSATELAFEFAEFLVEVAVAGWSRVCYSLYEALSPCRACTATFLADDGTGRQSGSWHSAVYCAPLQSLHQQQYDLRCCVLIGCSPLPLPGLRSAQQQQASRSP